MRSVSAVPHYQRASASLLAQEPAEPRMSRETPDADWPLVYQHLEARIAAFATWRLSWWSHWAEIARYMLPRRYHAFIAANTFDRGLRRDGLIIDETATLAGQVCAAGMMSGLTDPDRPWLKLGPPVPGMDLDRAAQMWFDDLTDRLRYIQAESNFYDSLSQGYEDMVFFGDGVVVDYESAEDILHCANYCAGEYFLGAGHDFSDEVLYAEFRLTVAQLVERYGLDKCPDEIKRSWAQKGGALESEWVVGHAIEPNFAIRVSNNREAGVFPGGFTWREIYWLRGKPGTGALSIAGFHEKPFAVMRWNTVSNDPYARGPGSDALGATIQLQLETARKAEAIEKVVRPPMGADASLLNQPTSTRPDGVTYVNTANGKPSFYPLYEIRPDIAAISADIGLIQERIGRIFFNNLFRMMEGLRDKTRGAVTATEIDALKAEQLMQLGPVIGRVLNEGIRPRIKRQLSILARMGGVPRIPDSLRGIVTLDNLKIEFISMLTTAQRAASTAAIERSFAFAQSIAPVYPSARFNLDPDEAVREFAELHGVPARVIRDPQAVKKLQEAEAQAQQAQAMAQTAMAGVQGAQTLSQANLSGQNALGALLGNAA